MYWQLIAPVGQICLTTCFVNKVLFMYCLWLLSKYNGRVESSYRDHMTYSPPTKK
jgi:hypothetical protein